jgi:hypothetical protein
MHREIKRLPTVDQKLPKLKTSNEWKNIIMKMCVRSEIRCDIDPVIGMTCRLIGFLVY